MPCHTTDQACNPGTQPIGVDFMAPRPVRPLGEVPLQVHQWLSDQAVVCTPAGCSPAAPASSSHVEVAVEQQLVPKQPCVSIIRPSENLEASDFAIRPALVQIPDCTTLAATVETQSGQCFWEWNRVPDYLKLKDHKGFRFFSSNKDRHASELIRAELSSSQIQYHGWGSQARGDHAVGSAALLMLLALICSTKQCPKAAKTRAINLMVSLVQLSVAALEIMEGCPGICYGADSRYHEMHLRVGATGVVENFQFLLRQHQGFTVAWGLLMAKGFCGYRISSAESHPKLSDILVFLAWAKTFPKVRKVWPYLGQFLWPKILFLCSKIIDKYAYLKSLLPFQPAPLLKTRGGRNRKVSWQNKLIFLKKNEKNQAP